ncbi:MAG TPA: hypothetical protein VGT24_07830 [Candidatus Acidoferrales bacterium]|nr:hypothetical protein [Candidatus Acidoferrales bacterium]
MQDLSERVSAGCGLYGVPHIGDIDLIACGLIAVYLEVNVGLAERPYHPQVFDPFELVHHGNDLVGFVLQRF